MFMHRLRKFGKASLFALSMLLVGGSLNSCKDWLDDYKFDDEEPEWLGASIYDFLKEGSPGHSYKNFVELIDSLGEKETLAHTGSNTLFVADDAAFERFYEENPWGVKSIAEMTPAQRKVLLYNSMLNNSLLLEMLSSTGAQEKDEGTCLRRTTSFSVIDTIPFVVGESVELHSGWPVYNKYWNVLRGTDRSAKNGIRLAMDGTAPMMVHFLDEYLVNNSIRESDVEFLYKKSNGGVQKKYEKGDAFIFDRKVVASGVDLGDFSDDTMTVTCKNGYIYRLDGVLLPPTNMAGELRQREDTRIFSHLLDRFCVPEYDAALSADYLKRYGVKDSVFRLRYFSKSYTKHSLLDATSSNPLPDELLNYDPGWNAFQNSLAKESDMAAMFVPCDTALYSFFARGNGNFLLKRFAPGVAIKDECTPASVDAMLQALDSVPQVNIASFLNNLMKSTFVGTVASKFTKVTNDANDDMNLREEHVSECVVANNGVIYILNSVFAPAAYSAVSAPTQVYDNMFIMRNIIKQLRYDYYLLAMDAEYSFIVPDDSHFVYYDPVTVGQGSNARSVVYKYHYDDKRPKGNGVVELWSEKYYLRNRETLELDTIAPENSSAYSLSGEKFGGNEKVANIMMDIMEYLIIVHDANEAFSADKKYYSTKGYGTIKVEVGSDNIKIYGGEQLETGTEILVDGVYPQENGYTYNTVPAVISTDSLHMYTAVPTPPTKSVFRNMERYAKAEGDLYYEFYKLCNPINFENLLTKIFKSTVPANKVSSIANDSLKLYQIFYNEPDNTTSYGIPFFNTYHYTVYVPANESIKDLTANRGLPTWDEVNAVADKEPLKAASMMRQINRFVRYHFQDNSVYHDKSPFTVPSPEGEPYKEATYATSTIDSKTGRFHEVVVKSAAGNRTIIVKDDVADAANENTWAEVVNTEGQENVTWNLMCRDIVLHKALDRIETSSFSVIQPLNRALLNNGMFGYDGSFCRFASTGELVDTMTVKGGRGGNAGNGEECYLVARCGKKEIEAGDGSIVEAETAYLMKPLKDTDPEWNAKYTREALVLVNEAPLLITQEGYLLEVIEGGKNEPTVIKYKTEGGKKIKLDNNGTQIDESDK